MRRVFFLLALLTVTLAADEIAIRVPTQPVKPGEFVMLEVTGLATAELKSTKFTLTPSNDVRFFPMKSWDDVPYLFFQTSRPGKYQIVLAINKFRSDLEAGLDGARAAKIETGLLNDLQVVVTKIGDKYPVRSGSAVLEVYGTVKPDDPKPDDPPPVDPNPGKIDRVTYVYEKDANITPRPVAYALQRLNTEYVAVVATEFEEDTVDGTGEVPDQYKVALDAARKSGLPALVIQAGAKVVRVLKDPKTEQQVMDAVLK